MYLGFVSAVVTWLSLLTLQSCPVVCRTWLAEALSCLQFYQVICSWFPAPCTLRPSKMNRPASQLAFPHHAQLLPYGGLLCGHLLSGSFSVVLLLFCLAFCFRWSCVSCFLPYSVPMSFWCVTSALVLFSFTPRVYCHICDRLSLSAFGVLFNIFTGYCTLLLPVTVWLDPEWPSTVY